MLENCKRLICSPSLNKVYCIGLYCIVLSITHSISELLCRLLLLLKPCETGASLFKRTHEASEMHERIAFEAR